MAIARRLNLLTRLLTILEGDGLVNDATALILTSFASAAVTIGSFSLPMAAAGFVTILIGETLWGIVVAAATLRVRLGARSADRNGTRTADPVFVFWPPHMLGGGRPGGGCSGAVHLLEGPALHRARYQAAGLFVWGLIVHLSKAC